MRFYEVVTPLRAQLAELSTKRGNLTEDLDTHRTQMKGLMEVTPKYTHFYTLHLNVVSAHLPL